ncbi:hypothetical protein Q7C36_008277 [Tachysurus vachellii]|uniref:Uncharacterized protein n=1 Tax=Tachysurus vachellii TaxID=175792 RepID=A0AA88NAB2_TACVA|nr:hypothetical protein Q7C36_008277 [Tachysurus vachellii]
MTAVIRARFTAAKLHLKSWGLNKSPLWAPQRFGIMKVPPRPGMEAILVKSLSQVLLWETAQVVDAFREDDGQNDRRIFPRGIV